LKIENYGVAEISEFTFVNALNKKVCHYIDDRHAFFHFQFETKVQTVN